MTGSPADIQVLGGVRDAPRSLRDRPRKPSLASLASVVGWLLAAAFVLVTFVVPLLLVVSRSVGDPFYASYLAVAQSESIRTITLRTLRLGAFVTLICLVLGYPAAYAMTKLGRSGKAVVGVLILIPFLTSSLVRTYGWIAILGTNGPLAAAARAVGLQSDGLNGTFTGLVVAMTTMLLPLMIMPVFASMAAIDQSQLRAAGALGAKPAEGFLRVYAPQTAAGVIAGTLLVFVVSLGFFITPALIGGNRETTIAQIIYVFINELFDWRRSTSLAVILLVVVALLLLVAGRFISLEAAFGLKRNGPAKDGARRASVAGAGGRLLGRLASHLPFQRHLSWVAHIVLWLDMALLLLPIVYVFLVSFQPLRLLALPTDGLSLNWYRAVFAKDEWFVAARNSLAIAFVSTALSMAAGFFLALRSQRLGGLARLAVAAGAIGPLALPHIVLAIGIYGLFIQLGWIGNVFAVALAHAGFALPYTFVNVANGLAGYDQRLDQAAQSLGARPWTVLRRIKIPLLQASVLTATALAFLTSFDELVVTLFIAGPGLPTLPVRMWAGTSQNISPELAVVGTLLILFVALIFAVMRLVPKLRRVPGVLLRGR